MQLLAQAQAEGAVRELPSLQRFVFVMGAVAAPVLAASGAAHLGLVPPTLARHLDDEVLSDAALAQRIDLALAALGVAGSHQENRT